MPARGRGARRKRRGQLTGSRDGRGGGHAGALVFSALSLGEDGGVQSEPLRGGGRSGGVGAAAQEPAATGPGGERESERGRGRRRLIPLRTWSRRRAELGLERLQPPAKVKPPPALGFCDAAFHLRGPRGSGQGPLGGRCSAPAARSC